METAQAYNYFVTTMQSDGALMAAATGGVWQGFAEVGTVAPYALVVQQVMNDSLTLNANRLMSRGVFQIKAVGPSSSYAALVTIADRIDALFKSVRLAGLSPSGGVLECYREQALAYDELVNGAHWSHLGGLYALDIQGS